jgi:hypothetical protein
VPAAAGWGWAIPAGLLGGAILLADDDDDRKQISR